MDSSLIDINNTAIHDIKIYVYVKQGFLVAYEIKMVSDKGDGMVH